MTGVYFTVPQHMKSTHLEYKCYLSQNVRKYTGRGVKEKDTQQIKKTLPCSPNLE